MSVLVGKEWLGRYVELRKDVRPGRMHPTRAAAIAEARARVDPCVLPAAASVRRLKR